MPFEFCQADDVEVRELLTNDDKMLVELFSAVFPEFVDQTIEAGGPARFLQDPTAFAFGAWVDGDPAGLAWGIQMRTPTDRLVSYLHGLDVRAQFRRRGIGSLLVKDSMALARQRGSTRFWLSTGGHDDSAQQLCDSLGGRRKPLRDVNYWWNLPPNP